MIEKLEPIKAFNCSDTPQAKMQHHSYHNDCINKINELVEAVNVLQAQVAILQEHAHPTAKTPEDKGYIKLDNDSLQKFLKAHPEYKNNGKLEFDRTRKALDKGMEHITGLNNMIESWLNLINSDLDQETKLRILKSAISAYVENKGGNNEK